MGRRDLFVWLRIRAYGPLLFHANLLPTCTECCEHELDRVDLLSLDVEGYEAQALRGIDFQRYRPRLMLIEVRDESEIEKAIGRHYQHVASLAVHDHRKDMLFKAKS